MLERINRFLFGSQATEFESSYALGESVARLKAVRGSIRESLTKQVASGVVSESRVVLRRVVPFVGNSFKPYFFGEFKERHGKVVLVGRFTIHWLVKAFMTFWLGFCAVWTFLALSATIHRPEAWFMPMTGVGMFATGITLVRLCRWLSRGDPVWLSNLIRQALAL
jgi:hypothetical protein